MSFLLQRVVVETHMKTLVASLFAAALITAAAAPAQAFIGVQVGPIGVGVGHYHYHHHYYRHREWRRDHWRYW